MFVIHWEMNISSRSINFNYLIEGDKQSIGGFMENIKIEFKITC